MAEPMNAAEVALLNDRNGMYKKVNGEPPSDMMKLYEYLHKKHIGNLATVKGILGLYK